VQPHGMWDPGAAERFGIDESQPLIVAQATGGAPAAQISISDPDVIIASVSPLPDGLRLRLFNPTSAVRSVTLHWGDRSRHVTLPPLGTESVRFGSNATRRK